MSLGKLIQEEREKARLSRKELAELAGISERTVFALEEDPSYGCQVKTIVALQNALYVNQEKLAKELFKCV